MKKKNENTTQVKNNSNYVMLLVGFFSGMIIMAIVGVLLYSSGYVDEGSVIKEEKKVVFTMKDVQQDIKEDFASGEVPQYNSAYCNAKYTDLYQSTASICYINNILTVSKMNPMVIEVECLCFS